MAKDFVVEWHPENVIDAVEAEVEAALRDGAELVKLDARRNLLRVREPEFGRRYRMRLALYELTSVCVKRKGRLIAFWVGIPKRFVTGKKGTTEKAQSYGYYIEVGTRRFPAHPWLRPALINNKDAIKALLER